MHSLVRCCRTSLPVPLNTFAAQALKFPVPLRREFLCKALSNRRFRSRAETCRDQNCENSLIFSLLAGYLMRRPARIGLPPPPRTPTRVRLSHVLRDCATFQRLSASVSPFARLWLAIGLTIPRLSPARLRLLKTLSGRGRRRPVRQYRRLVRNLLVGHRPARSVRQYRRLVRNADGGAQSKASEPDYEPWKGEAP